MAVSKIANPSGLKNWYNWHRYLNEAEAGSDYSDGQASCMVNNATVTVSIRTASRIHKTDDVIMTIPDGLRPMIGIYAIAKCAANDVCIIQIAANGEVSVWSAPSTTTSGRLVTSFSYVMA
jgi:hypothetical protein